jgi:hypothetical protein
VIGIQSAELDNLNTNPFKNLFISGYFQPIVTAEADVFFATVHPPPKGRSGLIFSDGFG